MGEAGDRRGVARAEGVGAVSGDRCEICDRPRADDAHLDSCPGCDVVCSGIREECRAHAVDWRARALAVEEQLAELRAAARVVVDSHDADGSWISSRDARIALRDALAKRGITW